jgi:two-component system, OmpR family, sensor histidine kinase KdpD
MKQTTILKRSLTLLLTLILATGLAFSMSEFGVRTENILLIYVGAVMVINIETKSLLAGVISAVLCALSFNFFFTEPKYTFMIADPNYFISMIIFIIVALLINTITSRLQKQMLVSMENENRVHSMYEMSKTLLNLHQIEDILFYVNQVIKEGAQLEAHMMIVSSSQVQYTTITDNELMNLIQESVQWSLAHMSAYGASEFHLGNKEWYIHPFQVKNQKEGKGLLLLKTFGMKISNKTMKYLDAVIYHLLIAIEREFVSIEKEQTNIQMAKEKFKSSLLRSISHDIKTPLTTLYAGSSFLVESYDSISDEEKRAMLKDINNETMYLSDFVDNLLNMTKIESNKLIVKKKMEIVEDLISEVIKHLSKRVGSHTIEVIKASEVLFIEADAQLIIQVLVNLLDNAIKHTRPDSLIRIRYYYQNNACCFDIEDDGGGVSSDQIDHIFDDFTLTKNMKTDQSRGTGIGLNICKSIILAHGGEIHAWNNDCGGATFKIVIPFSEGGGHGGSKNSNH